MKAVFSMLVTTLFVLVSASAFAQGAEAPDEMTGHVNVGDKAPGFTLEDQSGDERSLEGLLADADEFVALVFYRSANW